MAAEKSPREPKGNHLEFVLNIILTMMVAIAMISTVLIIFFMARDEASISSPALENTTFALKMATAFLIINAVLMLFTRISSRFRAEAYEKNNIPCIFDEISAIKNLVEDMSLKISSPSKRILTEELLEKLKLFSSQLNETTTCATRIKEVIELIMQDIRETEKESPRQPSSDSSLPECPASREQVASGITSSVEAYNSAKQKIDLLVEVIKERFPVTPATPDAVKSENESKLEEGMSSMVETIVQKLSEKREASDLKETPLAAETEKPQLYLAETKIEVSRSEKETSEEFPGETAKEAANEASSSEKRD